MTENLWGEIPVTTEVRTPYLILREQADSLTRMTKKALVGTVRRLVSPTNGADLEVKVPQLNGYRLVVLTALYDPVGLYPVRIMDHVRDERIECPDEGEFMDALREVLSSTEVTNLLSHLLSVVRSEEKAG